MPGLDDDLALALHLADVAAAVTLPAFGRRLDVALKADDTVVTEVDAAAERAVREALREHRPDDGVLGEEEGLVEGSSGRVWVLDPIDGTRMYAEGIPLWTTLVALRDSTGVLVGVADAPASALRQHAARGAGAWEVGRRLAVSPVDRLADSFVLHASVEEFAGLGETSSLERLVTASRGSRGMGDAWAHLMVARGSAEALVEAAPCYEWDWAATSLILDEAGGRTSALDAAAPYAGCRLLATNGRIDDELRATYGATLH
ncbi:MAG: inositol monophosphatase family protein [Candidatus Nanopelagicales bacterium]